MGSRPTRARADSMTLSSPPTWQGPRCRSSYLMRKPSRYASYPTYISTNQNAHCPHSTASCKVSELPSILLHKSNFGRQRHSGSGIGNHLWQHSSVVQVVHSERRQVLGYQRNKLLLTGSLPSYLELKSRKSRQS